MKSLDFVPMGRKFVPGRPVGKRDEVCFHVQVRGVVERNKKREEGTPVLVGKWDKALNVEMPDGATEEVWRVNPPAENILP